MEVQELIDRVHARRLEAINSFAVFCLNYDHSFIEEVFEPRAWLIDHLKSKFNHMYDKYGTQAAVIMFYMDLDSENRRLLAAYIIRSDYR